MYFTGWNVQASVIICLALKTFKMCRKQISKDIVSAPKKVSEANESSLIGLLSEHAGSWFSDSLTKEMQLSTRRHSGEENSAASSSTASQNRREAEIPTPSLTEYPGCPKLEESWPEDDDAASFEERGYCSDSATAAISHDHRMQQRIAQNSRSGNAIWDRTKKQHVAPGMGTADRQRIARRAKEDRFLGQPLKQRREPSKKVSSRLKHGGQIWKPSKA